MSRLDPNSTITDTKNHEAHTPPLSDYLLDLLHRRLENTASNFGFPGTDAGAYIIEPRKQISKVTASTGISFTVHDLRRTFITVAESFNIPAYALKRSLNHKMQNDVTAGYIIADAEHLRKPMQQITDVLLKLMGAQRSSEIIELPMASNITSM